MVCLHVIFSFYLAQSLLLLFFPLSFLHRFFTHNENLFGFWLCVRNGTPQFSAPTKTFQNHIAAFSPMFPAPFPLQWYGVENWRHKRQRSSAKIRTIYWKQQCEKRMSSNNKKLIKKVYKIIQNYTKQKRISNSSNIITKLY